MSADGRYVFFTSEAPNLVAGDTNARLDAFLHDLRTGATTRISVSSTGAEAKPAEDAFGGSAAEGMSANARYLVFRSDAQNLVPGDTNGAEDVFLRDRRTHRTTRISVGSKRRQGNGPSRFGVITRDGRYVAFSSSASNLVPGDTNAHADIFVRDRKSGRTTRVSVAANGRQANGDSEQVAISADGRYLAFESAASNLVPHDTNNLPDIFLRDRKTGRTTRVSVTSSGKQATGRRYSNGSNVPAISADGRYVAFHSDTTNLVPGDTNRTFDIFVHDRVTGKTERVSVGDHGQQASGENLGALSISADGRYVAFSSLASNLVKDDANDITDVFVRDLRKHQTRLVSLGSTNGQGADASWVGGFGSAFSANDRYLVFGSWAPDLVPGDTNTSADAFVRDLGRSS
jgi:Tol biopolymer transport system component